MFLPPKTEAERLEEMYAFEDRAELGWSDPGADCFDRSPERIDRLTDEMEREDDSRYWEEGRVY